MAEKNLRDTIYLKGKILNALVEDAIDDVLVVSLTHGKRCFRGVLLDSEQRSIPYGFSAPKAFISSPNKPESAALTTDNKPDAENGEKVELSALSLRDTYLQGGQNKSVNTLLPPRSTPLKIPKENNIRIMKLRPKQVLCAKCKNPCQESSPKDKRPAHETVTGKEDVVKRKIFSVESKGSPKRTRLSTRQQTVKTSPVIKISFTSPEGQGTVVKIPAKAQSSNYEEKESLMHKKAKKALKKAKEKARLKTTDTHHFEFSKKIGHHHHHHKHRLKHKHKHGVNTTKTTKNNNNRKDAGICAGKENSSSKPFSIPLDSVSLSNLEAAQNQPVVLLDSAETLSVHSGSSVLSTTSERSGRIRKKPQMYRDSNYTAPSRKPKSDSSRSSVISVSSGTSNETNSNSDPGELCDLPGGQTTSQTVTSIRPLMMRIQTRNVLKCENKFGQHVGVGDIVWGKITGFPWWPGRVISISVSQRDNGIIITQIAHVSWFASRTMSHMNCADLYPFMEDYNVRFNKKKRGPYKEAVRQAIVATQSIVSVGVTDETESVDIKTV